jgi:regulatory protein
MDDSRQKALVTAANVLTYKNRSSQALYDRLIEKEISPEDAAYAVARLIELGFLNDARYAEDLVSACRAKGWGRSRIRQELKKKAVDQDLADSLLEDFEPDYDKMKRLLAAKLKGDGPFEPRDIKRAADSLARRGFSWDQIKRALSEYTEQLEENE